MARTAVAVIGTGFMGAAHCEAAVRTGAQVVSVLGSAPQRASELAARYGAEVATDLDALLASPAQVVHVTSPNALHYEHAAAVLDSGRHLVCEKPLVTRAEHARDLIARAHRNRVIAATSFNLRFYSLVHHMRSLVAQGPAPTLVRGSYLQDWLALPTDWSWRVDPSRGGPTRALADIGSHLIDALGFVLDQRPRRLLARLYTTVPTRTDDRGRAVAVETDDAASLMVVFSGGTEALLSVSQVSAGRRNALSLAVDAPTHSLQWCSEDPDVLWRGRRDAPNEVIYRDPTMRASRTSALPPGHVEGFADTFVHMLEQVYADVAAGSRHATSTYASLADGALSVRVCEAALRSHLERTWVEVDDDEGEHS